MDSQTTAAPPAGAGETDDVVWADMRRDAEIECRKVGGCVGVLGKKGGECLWCCVLVGPLTRKVC